MQSRPLSSTTWRGFICVVALFALALSAIEVAYSVEGLIAGQRGSRGFGFVWDSNDRGTRFIASLQPDSPLAALGAHVGDKVVLDDYKDSFANIQPGQKIGLTLVQAGKVTHATVDAIAVPFTTMSKIFYVSGHLERLLGIFFALLIALKQTGKNRSYQALVLYFLLRGFNQVPTFTPPGLVANLIDALYWATFIPFTFFLLRFSVLYPNDEPTGLRRYLARLLPFIAVFSVIAALYETWWATGHPAKFAYYLGFPFVTIVTCLILLALWDGWRNSSGLERQRHQWLLVAFGGASFCEFLTGLPLIATFNGMRITSIVSQIAGILMEVAIAYAVLKHRIFDFSFAVNRTLVFSFTSIMLILIFFLAERLAHQYLHFESAEKDALLSGTIAFGLFFVFNRLHHKVDHAVERVLFRSWHANNSALNKFVHKANHYTSPDRLLLALGNELDRYTSGAGYALYHADDTLDSLFTRIHGSLADTPSAIESNDDIAVTLRTTASHADLHSVAWAYAGELALPMMRGASLYGIAIIGAKSNGTSYRPDELEALSFAVTQVGLDLFALRVLQLVSEVDELKRQAAIHEAHANAAIREVDSIRLALSSGRHFELPRT
jgi:hypothetical protein